MHNSETHGVRCTKAAWCLLCELYQSIRTTSNSPVFRSMAPHVLGPANQLSKQLRIMHSTTRFIKLILKGYFTIRFLENAHAMFRVLQSKSRTFICDMTCYAAINCFQYEVNHMCTKYGGAQFGRYHVQTCEFYELLTIHHLKYS